MPTYEYRCKACGVELEVVQSFTDDALTTCEACGGPLRKVFGSVGISFKGSGFYKTDSRGGGSKSGATAGSGESSSTSGESSSSADSSSGNGSGDKGGTSDKGGAASDKKKPAAAASTSASTAST